MYSTEVTLFFKILREKSEALYGSKNSFAVQAGISIHEVPFPRHYLAIGDLPDIVSAAERYAMILRQNNSAQRKKGIVFALLVSVGNPVPTVIQFGTEAKTGKSEWLLVSKNNDTLLE